MRESDPSVTATTSSPIIRPSLAVKPIAFVGAGPGDVELITVKGRRLLDHADCIVYAGSLINPAILVGCKARIHDSAGMNLQEIIETMASAWHNGQSVVRLHTGDPSIFGAIKEQMQRLDTIGIPYIVVPGVSSAFGAAAALKAELTLPEIAQTVIITRQEGRTPVPDLEKLRLLAAHQTTMLIFLSVSMIETVVLELLAGGYGESTPVAVVEKATWDSEQIILGTLADIALKIREAGICKTALICVGRVFADLPLAAVSKLYDKEFSHGSRAAA
ncbi:MAG: precorrin-4 C(11)-methyltransferase [Desulfocapsaceae bacterium]|nr:precorrin-4 C(11)-methyltransferase [Desulfocapsaceae bacterium]